MARKARTAVQKAEDKKLKIEKLEEQTEAIKQKLEEGNVEIEKERIESLVCLNDEKPLKIKPEIIESFLTIGSTVQNIECPTCGMVNRIEVRFKEKPNVGTAEIYQEEIGYAFMIKPVIELTDEELIKRVEFLGDKLTENKMKMTQEMQLLIRVTQIFLDKIK